MIHRLCTENLVGGLGLLLDILFERYIILMHLLCSSSIALQALRTSQLSGRRKVVLNPCFIVAALARLVIGSSSVFPIRIYTRLSLLVDKCVENKVTAS